MAPKSLKSKTGKIPLNLTDALIGDDGAMYFTTGGRGTQADLFRVTYAGAETATPLTLAALRDKEGAEARALRRKLEALNVQADPATVAVAWPHLLALARLGAAETQPAIIKALAAFPFAKLTKEQVLAKLRVIEVSIARQGVPAGESAAQVIADVDPLYPAKTEFANRELCQILLALNAPSAVAKTVALLKAAPTQEEQVTYAVALRGLKTGWNEDLRRDYLSWWTTGRSTQHPAHVVQWFTDAGINFNNGSSFGNLLKSVLKEAQSTMTPAELAALGDVSKPKPVAKPAAEPRKFVKDWKTADVQPLLGKVGKGRDFARGKATYEAAQCVLCHRFGEHGGAAGPDLTNVSTRFKRQDVLEAITEPSKVVSEQYMNTMFTLADGQVVAGRIAQETGDKVVVMTNPFDPATTAKVSKEDIKARELSKVSPMPPGLLSTCTEEEILDLLAYLESMGDPKHPNFAK